jgi:hypothetical protein
MQNLIASPEAFAISDLILSGFLRVVTHPRIFSPPTPLTRAVEFRDFLRERKPNCGRLSRSAGNRVGLRMDHDGSRLQPIRRPAMAPSILKARVEVTPASGADPLAP